MNFYKGPNGELINVVFPKDEEIELTVNGQPAVKIEADSVDAAKEKHVPAVTKEGDEIHVQVGEVKHPMIDTHWITNIWMEYPDGTIVKKELNPGEEPVAVFDVKDVNGKATVYEYCNIHGLWKKEIDL